MYRNKMFWLAFAVGGFSLAALVHAQNGDSSAPRTLSDRLQELRDSFSGQATPNGRSAQSGNSRDTSHQFGRPAQIYRGNKKISRQPSARVSERSDFEPVREAPTNVAPAGQSDFSPHPSSFSATPGETPATGDGSSRRRAALKRLGDSQAATESSTPSAKAAQDDQGPAPKASGAFDPPTATTEQELPSRAVKNPFEKPAKAISAKPAKKAEENAIAEGDLLASDLLIASESPVIGVRTAGPRKIVVGKEALFEVKVQNASRVGADGVVVSIELPEWAEVAGTEPTSGAAHAPQTGAEPSPLEWHIDQLAANSVETLRLRLVPRKSMPFELGVRYSFTPKSSLAKVEVQEPKLALRIAGADEVRYGQTETYRLIVANPGTGDAEDVVIRLLPNGPGEQAVASVKLGTIAAGDEIVREIAVTPREQGELHVRAEAVAAGGLTAQVDQQVLIRRAEVEIEAAGPPVRYSGTEATYNVTLTNTGNYTAENVVVAAKLPSGAQFVRDTAAGSHNKSTGEVTWRVVSLPAGATKQIEVVCLLSKAGVNHINISASGSDDIAAQTVATTRVDALADLRMVVVDPQGPVPTSEQATYQIRIENRGNKSAEEVDLIVFFSAGVEPVAAEGAAHELSEGQVKFHRITSIAAGEERVLKLRAKAKQGGSHIVRAELVCGELETKLAVEETTRFYDEASHANTATQAGGLSRQASAAPLRRVPTATR
jgi:uncharacterized repeat protein (TIGR01451 family)